MVVWKGDEILLDSGAIVYQRWDGKPKEVDVPADDPTI
jgi:hypothetical protein